MNKAKDSLKANLEEILANLPAEHQEDFKKQVEAMPDVAEAPLSGDDQIAAIKAELVANPDVDESAAAGELKEIKAPDAIVQPSEAELKEEMAKMLSEAEAQKPE
jgi:hypothetical protein